MAKRPTLKEIGEKAGVSVYTASQALAGRTGVATETRARVLKIASDIGYVPNLLARQLRYQQSRSIAILTANATNEFYPILVGAVQKVVLNAGYTCLVSDIVDGGVHSMEREDAFVRAILEQRVAGVVLCYVPSEENLRLLEEWKIPLVFVDCVAPERLQNVPSVLSDGHGAALGVGAHLASLGRRRWVLVAHSASWSSTRKSREEGFRTAAKVAGAALRVVEGGNDARTAYLALASLLQTLNADEWPDAVFATNEPLLNGTWQALVEAGARIPADVGVVGFDEFAWARLLTPPATVVDQSIGELGTLAGEALLDRMEGRSRMARSVPAVRTIPTKLVVRRSCGYRPAE